MRRAVGIVMPLVCGLLVLIAASAFPRSAVHGDAVHGPKSLAAPISTAPFRFGVHWGPGHRSILLTVIGPSGCRPQVASVTSTAPARLDVTVRSASASTSCAGPSTRRVLTLPLPLVAEPGQSVSVDVNRRHVGVPKYRRSAMSGQGTVQ